jgi:hypothetical protein
MTTVPARRLVSPTARSGPRRTVADLVLADDEATLLDVVDNVLTKGVVLTGELMIGLARVELVYARLSLLLCAADRVMPGEPVDPVRRHGERMTRRPRRRARRA